MRPFVACGTGLAVVDEIVRLDRLLGDPQEPRSQASPSNGCRSSGPFTEVSNLSFWFRHLRPLRFKGSPAHVSALSDPSIHLGIQASYT